ncbi:Arc family DNA-binding protein [Allobranchiibius sp. GilTou38]|nr:Arc family DNA-binding protein [Allobranchiibius sp. GilTou38]
MLLRLDPAVHEALTRLAQDELRSVNAEVEMLIREALRKRGRLPRTARPLPRRGRPRSDGG